MKKRVTEGWQQSATYNTAAVAIPALAGYAVGGPTWAAVGAGLGALNRLYNKKDREQDWKSKGWSKKLKKIKAKRKLHEGVGKWSVKKVKSYVNPYKMDDEEVYQNDGNDASYTKYHIKKNGKTVGRMRQDDYFGSMVGRLGGNNMPELKHYGRNKKSGVLSSLHAFMKSKTGKKWMARRKLDEVAPPGDKAERMVKHIKARYAKDGKLTKKEKAIAYATAWKAHNRGALEEGRYRLGIKGRKLKKSELERVAKQYAQWKKVKDKKGKSAADEYLSGKAGPTTAIRESIINNLLGKIKRLNESKMSDWSIDFEEKHGRKPTNDDLKRWHKLEKENQLQKKLNWKKIASRTGKVGRGGERG